MNCELFLFLAVHDSGFLILTHSSLEEVCLSLQGNHLHPVKGILALVNFLTAQGNQKPIRHTFDILSH